VKQGDTLGSLDFSVSKHDAYSGAHSMHPDTVQLFAVLDDATFVGPDQHVIDCAIELERRIQDHGQEFNWSKCKFLAPPSLELLPAISEFLRSRGVPIIRDAATLLGAPVGWDRAKMSEMALQSHAENALLFKRLQHRALPTQEAMLMLRTCGVPIPVYLSRVLPPAVFAAAAAAFDAQVLETAAVKLNLPQPLAASTAQQLQHKLVHGGFGLTATTLLSPIAYTCALAAAAKLLCEPSILLAEHPTRARIWQPTSSLPSRPPGRPCFPPSTPTNLLKLSPPAKPALHQHFYHPPKTVQSQRRCNGSPTTRTSSPTRTQKCSACSSFSQTASAAKLC
jgi:hypothetical protein